MNHFDGFSNGNFDRLGVRKRWDTVLSKANIENLISTLTPTEQLVLKLRNGLEDGQAQTLEEIGQRLSVTRERIRQIEAKAIKKIKNYPKARCLVGYHMNFKNSEKNDNEEKEQTIIQDQKKNSINFTSKNPFLSV